MKLMAAITVFTLGMVACSDGRDSIPLPESGTDNIIDAIWQEVPASEKAEICREFWEVDDTALFDFLTTGSDPMSEDQAFSFIGLLWQEC